MLRAISKTIVQRFASSNPVLALQFNPCLVQEPCSFSKSKEFQDIPEPVRHPVIGTALDYSPAKNFDPSYLGEHWIRRHQELGPIYKENVLPGLTDCIVYCCSPCDTEEMHRAEEPCPFRDPLGPLAKVRRQLGAANGLTNSNGQEWRKIRRTINPLMLHSDSVWQFTKRFYDVAIDLVEHIESNMNEDNEVPNFDIALNKWAFEGIGIVAFNTRLGAFNKKLDKNMEKMLARNGAIVDSLGKMLYSLPLWKFINTKELKFLKQAHFDHLKATETQVKRILSSKHSIQKNPLLDGILNSNNLCHRTKTMLLTEFLTAGIDTTSNCASFFLYALAANPQKQEIVRREMLTAIGKNGIDGKTLSQLPYFNAFTKEVQRMFPFVSSFIRRFSRDVILSGYRIPAGTHIVNTSNMVNSRNPKYFDDPNTFQPERWLGGKTPKERQKIRFVMSGPFGMGSRMCPGRKMAMQEVQLLLAAILSKYKVEYHHKPMKVKFRLVSFPSEKPQFKFLPR